MFCKNCGQEIDDKAVICPHCGVSQNDDSSVSDSGSIGWGFLGCCIPIVGLILFLVWRDNKPKKCKSSRNRSAYLCWMLYPVLGTCKLRWNWSWIPWSLNSLAL